MALPGVIQSYVDQQERRRAARLKLQIQPAFSELPASARPRELERMLRASDWRPVGTSPGLRRVQNWQYD